MFQRNQQDAPIVVRESQEISAALGEALISAGPDERAGLERAAALVAQMLSRSDQDVRAAWTRQQLTRAGVDPVNDSLVTQVAALRKAVPGLRLTAATHLVQEAARPSD